MSSPPLIPARHAGTALRLVQATLGDFSPSSPSCNMYIWNIHVWQVGQRSVACQDCLLVIETKTILSLSQVCGAPQPIYEEYYAGEPDPKLHVILELSSQIE